MDVILSFVVLPLVSLLSLTHPCGCGQPAVPVEVAVLPLLVSWRLTVWLKGPCRGRLKRVIE